MKTAHYSFVLAILSIIWANHSLQAENIYVLPDSKIQDAVNGAADGDTVIILGGIYNEDVLVEGKNIKLVREKGKSVEITGSLTYKNVTGPVVIRDFKIGRDSSKHLTLENCERVGVEDLNLASGGDLIIKHSTVVARSCQFAGNATFTGSADSNATIEIIDCNFGGVLNSTDSRISVVRVKFEGNSWSQITRGKAVFFDVRFNLNGATVKINGTDWSMHECYIEGYVSVENANTNFIRSETKYSLTHSSLTLPDGNGTKLVIYQSKIRNRLLNRAKRSWIGYNLIRYIDFDNAGSEEADIVGNEINGYAFDGFSELKERTLEINSANLSVRILNNLIMNTWISDNEGGIYGTEGKSGIWIHRCKKAIICNNDFYRLHGDGIYIDPNFGGSAEIKGNSFSWAIRDVILQAPFTNVSFAYNSWASDDTYGKGWVKGGVVSGEGNIRGSSPANSSTDRFKLWANIPSDLVDKGPPEIFYQDHDGTRNNIGPLGGHSYDADGWTSTKPIVLSGDHSPKSILKGTTQKIEIRAAGVVATPK